MPQVTVPEEISMVARNIYSSESETDHKYHNLILLIRFILSWYAQDFCEIETPTELQELGIETADLTRAQQLIQRDTPPLVKIASMLYFY